MKFLKNYSPFTHKFKKRLLGNRQSKLVSLSQNPLFYHRGFVRSLIASKVREERGECMKHLYGVRFQLFTAASMTMTVLWVVW
jgi:hypothetical protein